MSVINNKLQLELLIVSVYHNLVDNDLSDEIPETIINYVDTLIHHRDDVQATDLIDTIQLLYTELTKEV